MDIINTSLIKLLALVHSPFNAKLTGFLIRLALHRFLSQLLRHVTVESFRHLIYLRKFSKWLDAWNDRNRDAHRPSFIDEIEILLVVIEKLSDRIFGT